MVADPRARDTWPPPGSPAPQSGSLYGSGGPPPAQAPWRGPAQAPPPKRGPADPSPPWHGPADPSPPWRGPAGGPPPRGARAPGAWPPRQPDHHVGTPVAAKRKRRPDASPWHWLLLIPIVLPLMPGLYNRMEPRLLGLPFFYWCQLAFAGVAALTTAIVHVATKDRR